MMQTLLVPLDGSDLAARAIEPAARLARTSHARIVIVRARPDIRLEHLSHAESVVIARAKDALRSREVQAELADVVASLAAQGITAIPRLEVGNPPEVILAAAREHDADLIVMSTHGRGGLGGHWSYGSVADAVLREASMPILLVPANARVEEVADRKARVLVALDGSAFAEEALNPAVELARLLDAEVHLLRVVDRGGPDDTDAAIADAGSYLETIAARLVEAGYAVTCHVDTGSPADAIVDAARREGMDAVAMATHGRGGLSRLVMGSTATATIGQIEAPLLLVRPDEIRRMWQPTSELDETGTPRAATVEVSLSAEELALLRRLLEHPPGGIAEEAGAAAIIEALRARLTASEDR